MNSQFLSLLKIFTFSKRIILFRYPSPPVMILKGQLYGEYGGEGMKPLLE